MNPYKYVKITQKFFFNVRTCPSRRRQIGLSEPNRPSMSRAYVPRWFNQRIQSCEGCLIRLRSIHLLLPQGWWEKSTAVDWWKNREILSLFFGFVAVLI